MHEPDPARAPGSPSPASSPSWRPPAAAGQLAIRHAAASRPRPSAAASATPHRRRPARHRRPRSPRPAPAPTAAPSSAGSSVSAPAASPSSSRRSRPSSPNSTTAQKDVYISLEIYDNKVAANILKTQIAAGNAPDIIGPVGVEGLNLFRDQLLDLAPLIDEDRATTRARYDPSARRLLQDRRGRRHDRRAVRDLPVVPLVQQEAVRRGQAAVSADQGRRPRTRASRGTWTRSATSA